jgi:hypothetical protein
MISPLESLRVASRRATFGRKPLWQQHASTSAEELRELEERLQIAIPEALVQMLLELGYGDINEELSFRKEWITRVQGGPLVGHLIFAQDDRGNFYTADPESGVIHFLSRSEFGYCRLAQDFGSFMERAAAQDFKIVAWAEAQPLVPYPSEA